jgi:anti-anti-sigma regulatory factor
MTLRIERSSKAELVVLSLTGRMDIEDVAELQRLLSLEQIGCRIALDLEDVTLIDRDAVKFLARCEADSIRLENCPAYIREWIRQDRNATRQRET